jgi:hypothetical protein
MKRWLLSLLCALGCALMIYIIWGVILTGVWALLLLQLLFSPVILVAFTVGLVVLMVVFRFRVFKS